MICCLDIGIYLFVFFIKNIEWVLLFNKIKIIFLKGIFDEFVKVNNFIVYLFIVKKVFMKVIFVYILVSILYMNV